MTFEAIQNEVSSWPDEQVRKFQAFLVSLRHQRDPEAIKKLTAKLDDPDPSRWVTLEEAERRLGLVDDSSDE